MLYDLVNLVFSRDAVATNVSTIIDQLHAGLMVSVEAGLASQVYFVELICANYAHFDVLFSEY